MYSQISAREDAPAAMADDPMRKALIQIQGVFSELEKSRLVGKLRQSREAMKATNGKCEGRKFFGEVDPEEQATLKLMKSLRRKRKGQKQLSYAKIAKELNSQGIPTRTGAPWQTTTVQNILKR